MLGVGSSILYLRAENNFETSISLRVVDSGRGTPDLHFNSSKITLQNDLFYTIYNHNCTKFSFNIFIQ